MEVNEKHEVTEDILEEARKMGWVPEDEWNRDPKLWRPAEEFVERGRNIIPIIRKENENLKKDMEILINTQAQEIKRLKQQIIAEKDEEHKVELQKYQKILESLDKKELEAFRDGDADAFTEARREKQNLRPPQPPQQQHEQQTSPVFEDWRSKNPWYAMDVFNPGDADAELTAHANSAFALLYNQNPNKPEKELYEEVERKVKALFPDKFRNPNRDDEQIADTSTHGGPQKRKKTWSDLPKEAKDAYFRQKPMIEKSGREWKKEDFASDYWAQEA